MSEQVPSKERDAFEAWAADKFSTHRHAFHPERYLLDTTNLAWKAWQARADQAIRDIAKFQKANAELALSHTHEPCPVKVPTFHIDSRGLVMEGKGGPYVATDSYRALLKRFEKACADVTTLRVQVLDLQERAAQPPGLSQSAELKAVGEWVDAMKPETDRWLIRSGPEGYQARIVAGREALERAYVEMIFGEPTAANAEELAIHIDNLRDDENWVHGDGVGPVTYTSNFEDGWIEIARMPECSRPTKGVSHE